MIKGSRKKCDLQRDLVTDRLTYRQTYLQTDLLTDRLTYRQSDS